MKRNILSIAILSLSVLALSACSTAYAAGKSAGSGRADAKNETVAVEAAAEIDASADSAPEDNTSEENVSEDNASEENASADLKATVGDTAQEAWEKLRGALHGSPEESKEPRTVTVTASGTVSVVPDKVEISFGVNTQAKTAEKAQQENSEIIDKVIAHLTELGVEEKSIQTSGYNLYPDYDYSGNTRRLIGYQVNNMLTVRDQDIEDAGKIVAECVALGINDVNNFRFYASSYDEAYEEALEKAVAAATRKADVLAVAAGGELGPVLTLAEGWQDVSVRYAKSSMNMAVEEAAAMDSAMGMSLMPGETEIKAQVTATYLIR